MNTAARHTCPLSVAEFQATVYLSAGGAGPAGCVPATDAYQVDALPAALVLKDGIEPADASICNTIGKVMVSEHTLHVQVLDTDRTHLAVVRQLMSDLVNVVQPLVGYLGMNSCNAVPDLLPVGRALCLMSQFPLVMLQTLLGSLCKVRSSELSAIRADGKRLDAGIDADGRGLFNLSARFFADGSIHQNRGIMLPVRIHRNGNVLDLSVEASVKNDRVVLALRNAECPELPVYGAVLRVVKGLSVLLSLRQGMVGTVFPPVPESVSNLLDCVLQRLGVDLAEPGIDLLQRSKLLLCTEPADAHVSSAPQHRHIVERAVVRNAAAAEALREELRLVRCRIKPVFVRSQHSTNILILCSAVMQKEHQNEQIRSFVTLDIQCGISHRFLHQVSVQPAALPCGGKTQDSAKSECRRSWNNHSDYGSDARPRASVRRRKTGGSGTANDPLAEGIFLVLHAKGIRIPVEISVTVDTVLLRGNRRTYLGKNRGELYRTSKNKFQRPFISRLKPGRIPGRIS